jgi:hypothetical protein
MDLNRIPSTAHGHEFHSGLSRVVMVRKTEQRTFASGKTGEVSKNTVLIGSHSNECEGNCLLEYCVL